MSENNSKQAVLTGLLVILIVIVGVLVWNTMQMKDQLNKIQHTRTVVATTSMPQHILPANRITQMPVSAAKKLSASTTGKKPVTAGNNSTSAAPSLFNDNFFKQPDNAQQWNPYAEIQRMQREMDRAFNHAFNRFNQSPDFKQFFRQNIATPEMDVKDNKDHYTVIVNLPGADNKNISVNLNGQVLTVKGKQDINKQNKDSMGNIIFQERRSGMFERSITLPDPVKQSGMKTQVKNGVLTITIQKVPVL